MRLNHLPLVLHIGLTELCYHWLDFAFHQSRLGNKISENNIDKKKSLTKLPLNLSSNFDAIMSRAIFSQLHHSIFEYALLSQQTTIQHYNLPNVSCVKKGNLPTRLVLKLLVATRKQYAYFETGLCEAIRYSIVKINMCHIRKYM